MSSVLAPAQVPVLRNRKRAFIFFESPFDTFGPSSGDDPAAAERCAILFRAYLFYFGRPFRLGALRSILFRGTRCWIARTTTSKLQ